MHLLLVVIIVILVVLNILIKKRVSSELMLGASRVLFLCYLVMSVGLLKKMTGLTGAFVDNMGVDQRLIIFYSIITESVTRYYWILVSSFCVLGVSFALSSIGKRGDAK